MLAAPHVQIAAHWWSAENTPNSDIRTLVPFLFLTTDALYASASQFPEMWAPQRSMKMRCGGTNSLVISFDIGPEALFALRGAVGLSGDAYCLVRRLQASKIERLNQPLAEMATALEKFRDLRNFFSHLDDRLAHLDRHGITGTVSAGCGIEYENAKGCFHLVLMGNRIHFTSSGVALEVDVSKVAVLNMLRSARLLYAEITSHKIHKQNYPGPEALYA